MLKLNDPFVLSRLTFLKSEHDFIFPYSEIINTFKLFIELGVDSHLAYIHKNCYVKSKKLTIDTYQAR